MNINPCSLTTPYVKGGCAVLLLASAITTVALCALFLPHSPISQALSREGSIALAVLSGSITILAITFIAWQILKGKRERVHEQPALNETVPPPSHIAKQHTFQPLEDLKAKRETPPPLSNPPLKLERDALAATSPKVNPNIRLSGEIQLSNAAQRFAHDLENLVPKLIESARTAEDLWEAELFYTDQVNRYNQELRENLSQTSIEFKEFEAFAYKKHWERLERFFKRQDATMLEKFSAVGTPRLILQRWREAFERFKPSKDLTQDLCYQKLAQDLDATPYEARLMEDIERLIPQAHSQEDVQKLSAFICEESVFQEDCPLYLDLLPLCLCWEALQTLASQELNIGICQKAEAFAQLAVYLPDRVQSEAVKEILNQKIQACNGNFFVHTKIDVARDRHHIDSINTSYRQFERKVNGVELDDHFEVIKIEMQIDPEVDLAMAIQAQLEEADPP